MAGRTASDGCSRPAAPVVRRVARLRRSVTVTELDFWTGPIMFWLAIAFLVVLTGYVCELSIATSVLAKYEAMAARPEPDPGDSSGVSEAVDEVAFAFGESPPKDGEMPGGSPFFNGSGFAWLLVLMYPVFFAECLVHRIIAKTPGKNEFLNCLFPPLRMGGRDHADGRAIWLPNIGWATVGPELQLRVERAFSGPMILIGLAVLPLLGFEWYLQSRAVTPSWQWGIFLRLSEAVIWLAFTLEFIIMFSIAPKKLQYCRQHWVDIVIIILPLIAFLRILRLGRVLRLHRVARVGRVYRLRGVGLRLFRGVLLMDLARQFFEGDLTKRLQKMRADLAERELEIQRLRAEIAELEEELGERGDVPCTEPSANL